MTRDIVRRDYRVALKVATRASTLAHDKDPAILALIAGIHHATGAHSEAVDWQQKAVDQLADTLTNWLTTPGRTSTTRFDQC